MVYNLSFPILGGIYDVDELDNESQEHQHRKDDDHIGQADGERAWRCHRAYRETAGSFAKPAFP